MHEIFPNFQNLKQSVSASRSCSDDSNLSADWLFNYFSTFLLFFFLAFLLFLCNDCYRRSWSHRFERGLLIDIPNSGTSNSICKTFIFIYLFLLLIFVFHTYFMSVLSLVIWMYKCFFKQLHWLMPKLTTIMAISTRRQNCFNTGKWQKDASHMSFFIFIFKLCL